MTVLLRDRLRRGDAGVAQTVGVMAELARRGIDPVRRMLPPPADPSDLMRLIAERVEYEPDPADAELVRAPWRTLRDGRGDCDCLATLAASAALAAGWPARFVTVGTAGVYSHVYAEAFHGGRWHPMDFDPLHGADRRGEWPVSGLGQGSGYAPPGGGDWKEEVLRAAGKWIRGLFGSQAAKRNERRISQNNEAFRRAADGDAYSGDFLRARTGQFGTTNIPVVLPYAISPSTGRPETPGPIDGWATDVARRHAATLLARLTGEPDPHPGIEEELYTVARNEGQDAAVDFIRIVAGIAWDAAPASWKQAVLRGAADRHLGPIHRQASAAMPLLLGAGLIFALGRRK